MTANTEQDLSVGARHAKATARQPSRPSDAMLDLARLITTTTEALSACVGQDGVLWDPAARAPTPPDHYAATFTALALAVKDSRDRRWSSLIDRWSAVPVGARGHAQFNRLALLLLAEHLEIALSSGAGELSKSLPALLGELAGRERRRSSNNCVLLAYACDALTATSSALAVSPDEEDVALRSFDGACESWLTSRAGFFDTPATRDHDALSVPICYHAKCALLLALVTRRAPTPERRRRLSAATEWLAAFTDEQTGHLGGYGRSSHALYGTACAIFVHLDAMERTRSAPAREAHAHRARELCALLERSRRDDGLLSITPNVATGARGGWDRYMHLSVYNAFAAGLLSHLMAFHLPRLRAESNSSEISEGARPAAAVPETSTRNPLSDEGVFLDREAGLLACRGHRAAAFLALRGGVVQDFDAESVDLRYAGLRPFFVRCDGRAAVGPPVRVAREELLKRPYLAGWTPVFRVRDSLYGLCRFDAVDVEEDGEGRILVVGLGAPRRLHDVPRRRNSPGGWLQRLDARFLDARGRRRRALDLERLPGHEAAVAIAFDGQTGWWGAATVLFGCESDAVFLNPFGHQWLGEAATPVALASSEGAAPRLALTGSMPASLPGASAACGAPVRWPTGNAHWIVVAGPALEEHAPSGVRCLLRIDPGAHSVSTPWAERALRRRVGV